MPSAARIALGLVVIGSFIIMVMAMPREPMLL